MTYEYERRHFKAGDNHFVETAPDREKLPEQCQTCHFWRINCAEGKEFEPEECGEK